MRRTLLLAAVVAAAPGLAIAPAAASAQVVELGDQTGTPLAAPSCPHGVSPAHCFIILTQVTALATISDGVSYPTRVHKPGRIIAFSVGLSSLSSNPSTRHAEINYLNQQHGGDAQVAIAVLRHVGKGGNRWKTVEESSRFHVVHYFGSVAQIPLLRSLEVRPGETIALTTPTWAPVLAVNVSSTKFAYRQSRTGSPKRCGSAPTTDRAQKPGQTTDYGCKYTGTRVEYAATEVTYPVPSNPVF